MFMGFDWIIGNETVKQALSGMLDSGRIPHAIMFYENDGCGALDLSLCFLENLLGSQKVSRLIHPDVYFIFPVTKGSKVTTDKPTSETYLGLWRELVSRNPFFLESDLNDALGIEGKSSAIAVAESKYILDKLSLGALEGGYRAVVVYLPEKMNTETANRLLKSIEEPPEKTQFIFITHAPDKVLPTISSRCQGIRILSLQRNQLEEILVNRYGKSTEEAALAASMAGGSLGKALALLADTENADGEFELFSKLMDALVGRNLGSALDCAEQIAAMPSKEKIKDFCRYSSEGLRSIFLLQQGLTSIVNLSGRERPFFEGMSKRCRKSFSRNALPCFDEALRLIERNVNLKILFCDLVDRLYMMV